MDPLTAAQIALIGVQIGSAAVQGISSAISAKHQIQGWVDTGHDPTAEELASLKGITDSLMATIRSA